MARTRTRKKPVPKAATSKASVTGEAWPVDAAIGGDARSVARPERSPLAAAVAAARERRLPYVLSALLVAWRTSPSDGLSELIGQLSQKLRTAHSLGGKSKAALGAWSALAAKATPQDVPALLETFADATSGDALKRLRRIARWMPDPRVDAALVDLIERVPYRATSTRPFWVALFEVATDITDTHALRRLEYCTADGVALTMQAWLRQKIAALREDTAWKLGAVNPEPPEVTEIAMLLGDVIGPGKLSRGSRNLEALLQAIYDAPDDDAPRLVYADALIERGDPRGEFISLQLRKELDRDGKKREKELLAAHGKQWLGELGHVLLAGYTFERGFLAECKVDNRHQDRVKRLAGHPAWATVRSIAGSALIALHPVMKGLRRLAFTSYEARNYEGLADSWRDLLIDTERPIEALRYTGVQIDQHWETALENNDSIRPGVLGRWVAVPEAQEVAALCSCRALPKLRELVVVSRAELVAAPLFASQLIRRLQRLGFVYDTGSSWSSEPGHAPVEFREALRTAPVPTLSLEFGPEYHATRLELERREHGYHRAAIVVGPTSKSNWSEMLVNEVIGILDALPASVRELRVTTRKHTEPQQAARLRAAVEQLELDVAEVGY